MAHERDDDTPATEAQADQAPAAEAGADHAPAAEARADEAQTDGPNAEDAEPDAATTPGQTTTVERSVVPARSDEREQPDRFEQPDGDEEIDGSEGSDVFIVDEAGEIEVEVVETELFAVDADGEIIEVADVAETIEAVDVTEAIETTEAAEAPETAETAETSETIETSEREERDGSSGAPVARPEGAPSEGDRAWRMPAETAPQERIWMSFPPGGGNYLGESDEELTDARTAWTEVAHSILRFEPVTMVVDPHDIGVARRFLSTEVDVVVAPLDDAWMRDIGPTFVLYENGRLGAVTWRFNGWGGQEWANWENDSVIGATVAARAGATRVVSDLVNEGGGIQVDGLGTVLLTETVQLDPGRNPGVSKEEVEAEFARTLGSTNPIWLKRGLHRDAQTYGTRGHVDILATFPSPGRVLVHSQQDVAHPDHEITREVLDALRDARTPEGVEWDLIELPAPQVLRDDSGFVDYSYVNHLVVNGGVIACTFDDPNDEPAQDILTEAYAGREIVGVDARALFARGGGIHCITQQQPAVG